MEYFYSKPLKNLNDDIFLKSQIIDVRNSLTNNQNAVTKILKRIDPLISEEYNVFYKKFFYRNIVILSTFQVKKQNIINFLTIFFFFLKGV